MDLSKNKERRVSFIKFLLDNYYLFAYINIVLRISIKYKIHTFI